MSEKYFHLSVRNVPLYFDQLVVILSNDVERIAKQIPDMGEIEIFGYTNQSEYRNKSAVYLVLNFHAEGGNMTHGIIAHEALHTTNFILSRVDVLADYNNDEAQAYLLTWVVNEVYKEIKKHGFNVE